MNQAAAMTHVCDGCGAAVDAAHVQQRIRRLELATRFRPLHIHTLLLLDAPPAEPADDFYASGESSPSEAAGAFFQAVARAAGVGREGKSREEVLAGLQRAGVYVAYAMECPVSKNADGAESGASAIEKLILRVRFSYKPKHVIAVGGELRGVVAALTEAGLAAECCAESGEESLERALIEAMRRAGGMAEGRV